MQIPQYWAYHRSHIGHTDESVQVSKYLKIVSMESRLHKPTHAYAGVATAVLFGWLIVLFIISYLSFK